MVSDLVNLKLQLVFYSSFMALSFFIGFLFFLSYVESKRVSKVFLGSGILAFSISAAINVATTLSEPSPLTIGMEISSRWFDALGLILISYIVIKEILGNEALSLYYLIFSFVSTTSFAVLCLGISDLSAMSYELEWTAMVWEIVQALLFGVLTIPVLIASFKLKSLSIRIFGAVFFIWSLTRLIHLINHQVLKEEILSVELIHYTLDFSALILLFIYSASRIRNLFKFGETV